ncbi:TPA: hypothetical protein ACH3X1_004361 [Trebouxia sp. C0004]
MRTTLFTLDLCETIWKFTSKEIKREHAFGKLICEFLRGQLSDVLTLTHQLRGESITDIRLQVEMAGQLVTLVYIEIKREAGHSGDAQQAGMAYLLQDCASEKFMSSSPTLRPALLVMAWQSST